MTTTLSAALHANVPALLWGAPGTGKSATIAALAAGRGDHLEVLSGGILADPADITGPLAVVDGEARYLRPAWLRRLLSADTAGNGTILFIDELTCASAQVQAALLRLVQERCAGETPLPAATRIVAAANPADQAAAGADLPAPTANRWVHVQWTLQPASWASWMLAQPDARPERASVAAYIHAHPAALLRLPGTETERGAAWPSPRSWDAAARLMAALPAGPDRLEALACAVGAAAAAEYAAWIRQADLPDPEDVLAGRAPVPVRADARHAALLAVAAAVLGRLTAPRWARAWEILGAVAAEGRDSAVIAAGVLARDKRSKKFPAPPEAADLAGDLLEVVHG